MKKNGTLLTAAVLILFGLLICGCPNGTTDLPDENTATNPADSSAPSDPADTPAAQPLTYSVIYNANGAASGSVPVDSNAYEENGAISVLANTGRLKKTYYTFGGWNTAADGSGSAYAPGAGFTMGAADVTLYAQWNSIDYTRLFTEASAGLTGVATGAGSFADIDGDGDQDLLITGDTGSGYISRLYTNDGAGRFTDSDAGLTGVAQGSSCFADVDNDGDRDFLITGRTGSLNISWLYINNGSGSFTVKPSGAPGVFNSSSSFTDIDGDGDQDLLITGQAESGNLSGLYVNDGSGSFSESNAGLTGVDYSSSCIADVDGDGRQDLLITGNNINGRIARLYFNDSSNSQLDLTGVYHGSSSFADVDGDGDQDLLITGAQDGETDEDPDKLSATLYINDGSGGFTDADAGLKGVYYSSSCFTDVDDDGDQDLVITGDTGDGLSQITRLYLNDGSGAFSDASAALTGVWFGSSSFADVDGDGDMDLLVTGLEGPSNKSTRLYLNGLY